MRPICEHPGREVGICEECGECDHDVILNGACYYCGATDVSTTVKAPDAMVPAERLRRKLDPRK